MESSALITTASTLFELHTEIFLKPNSIHQTKPH